MERNNNGLLSFQLWMKSQMKIIDYIINPCYCSTFYKESVFCECKFWIMLYDLGDASVHQQMESNWKCNFI